MRLTVPGITCAMNCCACSKDFIGVDQNFADIGLEVVADGADHQAALLIDQEGAFLLLRGAFDGLPQLQEIVEVPLQFFAVAPDRRGAGDQAHALCGTGKASITSRSSVRSLPSTRRETPPPRGLLGISTR
jgi:hypothetical protein